ncbi:hypothetical protein N752_07200 [Desulforamulus aquiferis]|nr:ABC transporter ATP-binding protein [Desulforamulus aquiferis]RYD05675.1 hypothetical protein N752_07200 [Desulforamulus aquiferis]
MISISLITLIQIVIAFFVAPSLTCLVLTGGVILFIFLQTFAKQTRSVGQEISSLNRDLLFNLTEHLNGMKEIKSYGVEAAQISNFVKIRKEMKKNSNRFNQIQVKTNMIYKIGSAIFISLCLFSAIEIFTLNPQDFIVIAVISARLWPRLSSLQIGLQNISTMLPAFQVLRELENQCLASQEVLEADTPTIIKLEQGIEFRGVSFYYENSRTNYALKKIDFFLTAGTTTAIVGSSGAGKSTLVDLLIGLLQPKEGEIYIDDQPLSINKRKWRNTIGYVPQDAFLFNSSIRENLQWFCPDSSEEMIWEALKLASVDTFVSGLPDGLDTVWEIEEYDYLAARDSALCWQGHY